MTVVFPDAVKQQGNTSVVFVSTVADPTAPKLATEINAGTSVNVSCFLYSGGDVTSTQNTGAAPRRLCTTTELQQFGTKTTAITDVQYVYSPQGAPTDPSNAAKTALVEGTVWYMIQRRGLSATTSALATTQKVKVTKVQVGAQNEGVTGTGEFDEFSITQSIIALSPPVAGVIAT